MFVSSATPQAPPGARAASYDGRIYRYCQAGASDLVAGNVVQGPAIQAGNLALAVNTTSGVAGVTVQGQGAASVAVTAVSSVGANVYADGYLAIASGAGQGLLYSINNHAAISTGATGAFNLYSPEDTLQVSITTTSTVSIMQNPYKGVIQSPITTATGMIVGVAGYIIKATQWGWIQTWGPAAVITEGTPALGAPVTGTAISSGGFVAVYTTATLLTQQLVGYMMQIGVASQECFVDLRISP